MTQLNSLISRYHGPSAGTWRSRHEDHRRRYAAANIS